MASPGSHDRTFILASVLMCLALLLPGVPGALAQDAEGEPAFDDQDDWADMQGLAVGDHWQYELTGDAEGTAYNEVQAVGNHTGTIGSGYETLRIAASAHLQTKQYPYGDVNSIAVDVVIDVDAHKWVRTRDHATVEVIANTSVEGAPKRQNVIAYDPPLVEYVFPFGEGFAWKADVTRYNKQGDERSVTGPYFSEGTVVGRQSITTKAGTFDAWHITYGISDDRRIERWYSEEVCELVQEEIYDRSGSGDERMESRMELVAFQCSHLPSENPTYDTSDVRLISGTPRKVDPVTGTTTEGPAIAPPAGQDNDAPAPGVIATLVALGLLLRRRAKA